MGAGADNPGTVRSYVARQPVFDERLEVWGYELLFRSGLQNWFPGTDLDEASSKVIAHGSLLDDLATLTGGRRALVNVTREVLLRGWIRLLPSALTVVELLESIEPDAELVAACRALRREGYALALDDFTGGAAWAPLVSLANVIKIDVLATTADERRRLVRELSGGGRLLLAEKVETREDVAQAREMGFTLFQGFFFARPAIVSRADVPPSKLHVLQLLREIHRDDLDLDELDQVIKQDLSLCYKLLRYINSAMFGLRREIRSVRRALVYLGPREVRKWATLVAVTMLGADRPEAVNQAIVRARFCEMLAPRFGLDARGDDLFLVGMFSLLDTLLGRPLGELIEPLPLPPDVRRALLGDVNDLSAVREFVLRYERGEWARATTPAPAEDEEVGRLYIDAVAWGGGTLRQGP